MKLLFCKACHDLIRLHPEPHHLRQCRCQKCLGFYLDDREAYFQGPCIPLGIDNNSLAEVVRRPNLPGIPYADLYITAFRFRIDSPAIKFEQGLDKVKQEEIKKLLAIYAYGAHHV